MFSCENPQYHPTWPNGPVGASNVFPVHFPSLPGSDYLSSSDHNGGLFIPPTYDGYSPSSHTACHLMWQSTPGGHAYPMGQFFEPGHTCFIPHEPQYMFTPGYSSGPAPFNVQHHWSDGSGEQNFTFSSPSDEGTTDYQTDATEYCLSNNDAEQYLFPETCEAGLGYPHCQEMPSCNVEQLDVTAENLHFDNIQPCDLMWQSTPRGHAYPMGQFDMVHFFEPGHTCFIPHEPQYMFIPPGHNSGPVPFNTQHHWSDGSGEQNFTFSSPSDESTTDYQTDAAEYCLSNNDAEQYLLTETCEAGLVTVENLQFDNIQLHHQNNFSEEQNLTSNSPPDESTTDYLTDASEHCLSSSNVEPYSFTETREAELAPPHCQEIPASSVEQPDVTAENVNFDNIKTEDPDPRNIQEERPSKPLSEKTICQHDGAIIIWEIEMPQPIAEQFIGKEGQYLKFVMQHCGGLVYMSQHPHIQHYMLCNIMGTKQQVKKALDSIRKRVKCTSLKNVNSAPSVTFGDHLNETPSEN